MNSVGWISVLLLSAVLLCTVVTASVGGPTVLTHKNWRQHIVGHERSFVLFYRDDDEGQFALRAFNAVGSQDHDPSQDGFFGTFLIQDPASFYVVMNEMNIGIHPPPATPFVAYVPHRNLNNAVIHREYLASRYILMDKTTELSGLRYRRGRDLLQLRPKIEHMNKIYGLLHRLYLNSVNGGTEAQKAKIMERIEGVQLQLSSDSLFSSQSKRVSAYVKRFNDKGVDFLEAEKSRISSMVKSTGMSMAQKHRLNLQQVVLDSFDTTVPKYVHFIKSDDEPSRFNLMHYLAIRSAHYHIKPDRLYFHTVVEPSGKWWQKAKKYVTVEYIREIPTHIGDVPLHLAAHISDALRYQILNRLGGVYMDLDVITIKSFDSIWQYPMTLALEKSVEGYEEVVCNAVIMARPGHPFLATIQENQPKHFKQGCYSCHSVIMIRDLALWHPEEVNILDWHSFYYPGWEAEAYRIMFGSNNPAEVDWSNTYAIHLFASNGNYQPYSHMMDENYILNNDSNFNRLVRRFLLD